MGTELFKGFGVDIAAEIAANLGPGIPQATLLSRTVGTAVSTDLNAGASITESKHTCKAFLDNYDSRRYKNTQIAQGTRVIVILGDTLPKGVVPKTEDRIIAEGTTFVLAGSIVRDPAGATYVCEVVA